MEDDVTLEEDGSEEKGGSEEELEAVESSAAGKVAKVKKELDACKAEKQEYLDGWQRSKADYANAVRRFDEEKLQLVSLGKVAAAKAFLPALDSLARAEAAGGIPESFQGVVKQLHDGVAKLGLTQFGAVGDIFDPNLHEALGQDATTDATLDETISVVLELGWMSGEQVLRAAKVRVAQLT
jgi:molecular chaperone GrpE